MYDALLQACQPQMLLVKSVPMVAPYLQVDLLPSVDVGLTLRYMAIHQVNDSVSILMALDYITGTFLHGNEPIHIAMIALTAST